MTNKQISPQKLHELLNSDKRVCLVDVREAEELQMSCLPGAIHIPLAVVPEKLSEFVEMMKGAKAYDEFVLLCRSGQRSEMARQWLVEQGVDCFCNLSGGLNGYGKAVDPSVAPY